MRREDLVDFLAARIEEEAEDSSFYSTWSTRAEAEGYSEFAEVMKQIAADEKKHRACILKMLATMAKEGS